MTFVRKDKKDLNDILVTKIQKEAVKILSTAVSYKDRTLDSINPYICTNTNIETYIHNTVLVVYLIFDKIIGVVLS